MYEIDVRGIRLHRDLIIAVFSSAPVPDKVDLCESALDSKIVLHSLLRLQVGPGA
jgi:hypothetical protein